jgi:hypothetical protein
MRLCFLFERRYTPYSKWLGSAFAQLEAAKEIGPPLAAALSAARFAEREEALVEAFEWAGRQHNDLGLTDPVDPTARDFHGRPFRVLGSDRFVEASRARIADPWLRSLPPVGSVDQLADSTDVLSYPPLGRRLGAVYGD